MPVKKRDFRKAAVNKGFIETRKGDRIFYRFTDSNGKIYNKIHTKVSRGAKSGDISGGIFSAMKKQFRFDKN